MEPKSPQKKQEEVAGLDAEVNSDPIVKLKSQDGGTSRSCRVPVCKLHWLF